MENGTLLSDFFGLDIPSNQAGGCAGKQPVGLVTRPGDVVNVAVVREQLEQLAGVDPVIGGQGGGSHVPQAHHAVVRATEQPGGLRAVEHQAVHCGILLLNRLPLVKTNLR